MMKSLCDTVVTTNGNTLLRLHRVQGPYVDIFAVEYQDGLLSKAAHHVARFHDGEIFPGLPTVRYPGIDPLVELRFVYKPAVNAALQEIGVVSATFDECAIVSPTVFETFFMRLLENSRYFPAISEGVHALHSGVESFCWEKGQTRCGLKGEVLWLKVLSGRIKSPSLDHMVWGPEDGFLAVPDGVDLVAVINSRVQIYSQQSVFNQDEHLPSFIALVNAVCWTIAMGQLWHERQDKVRIQTQREGVEKRFHRSLEDLAGLADQRFAGRNVAQDPEEGLKLAYAAVQAHMGMPARDEKLPSSKNNENADNQKIEFCTESTLVEWLREDGLYKRRVCLEDDWWRGTYRSSMIGYDKVTGAAVALLANSDNRIEIYDSTTGERSRMTLREADRLKSYADLIYQPLPKNLASVVQLFRLLIGMEKSNLRLFIAGGLGASILALAPPVALGWIFNNALPISDVGAVVQISMMLILVAAGFGCFEYVKNAATLKIACGWDFFLDAAINDRFMRLPVPFFRQFSVGDLAQRASSVLVLKLLISGACLAGAFSAIFGLFSLSLLFFFSWKLACISVPLALGAIGLLYHLSIKQIPYRKTVIDAGGELQGLVGQMLYGFTKIRLSGSEKQTYAILNGVLARAKKAEAVAQTYANQAVVASSLLPMFSAFILFGAGYLVLQSNSSYEELSMGRFLAFQAAFMQFVAVIVGLGSTISSLVQAVPLLDYIGPIVTEPTEEKEHVVRPARLTGQLELRQVAFKYPEATNAVLDSISLTVSRGDFVAIVGPSGSGKTTLIRLLLGFERPTSGTILFDDIPFDHMDIRAVRRQTGVVLQDGTVHAGSIYANIVGDMQLSETDAWEVARQVGLADDIRAMPKQMQTHVVEGGVTLSGGQKQRLLLARALVHKPRLVLLDEATSALDNVTQNIVMETLTRLNVTRIVIAHRLSTIIEANKIVVMEQGHIVETGTYDELIEKGGLFYQIAQRQLADT